MEFILSLAAMFAMAAVVLAINYITLWHFIIIAAMPAIYVVVKPNLSVVPIIVFVNKILDRIDNTIKFHLLD